MRVYVASSWRNTRQPCVVAALREAGHTVYDFRNPEPNNTGFQWSSIDKDWQRWTATEYIAALEHPIAVAGYTLDMRALRDCDACVLVMPCGRSAHLEAGYAIGAGKPTVILLTGDEEPELMYKMAAIATTIKSAVDYINNCCHYLCAGGWNVATSNLCTHTSRIQP